MANMSNSRFENTFRDLQDCYEALFSDKKLTEDESYYRDELIKLCKEITEQEFTLINK